MKFTIRTRLSLQFTYIVTFILILFSFIIYYFSDSYREAEFYSRLEKKAMTTAKLLIHVKEVDYNLMKIIDRNTVNAINNETVMIFDNTDKQIYNSSDLEGIIDSKALISKIRQSGHVRFHQGEKEVIGMLYVNNNIPYVILASALDSYGLKKLSNLKWIIIVGFFISIGMTVYLSKIYATRALKPMSDVVSQVDKINIANMNLRVNEGNGTDEIAQLAITFNKMLARLESAFQMQRSFVSNASHELRTPLTSITGQIEVSLMKSRTQEEYRTTLESVLEDIKNLNALSNGLLDLAKASSDISAVALHALRIDEILWQTRSELLARKKDYNITIHFSQDIDDEKKLMVLANDHLLKTAITNIMDNACKFSSNKSVEILLSVKDNWIKAAFSDTGIGIEKTNMENIFVPFFRAENAKNVPGNGLGLSLTDKIIRLHQGTLSVDSVINQGTIVTIEIPCMT